METIQKFGPGNIKNTGPEDSPVKSFPSNAEGNILYYIAVIFSLFQVGIASHLIEITGQLQLSTHVGFLGLLCFPLVASLKNKKIYIKLLLGYWHF